MSVLDTRTRGDVLIMISGYVRAPLTTNLIGKESGRHAAIAIGLRILYDIRPQLEFEVFIEVIVPVVIVLSLSFRSFAWCDSL